MEKATRLLITALALMTIGCDQLGEQATKAIESRLQQETDKMVDKAINAVDKTVGSVESKRSKDASKPNLIADESLLLAGVSPTNSAFAGQSIAIYCTFEKTLEASLEARFLNEAGAEIGRSQQGVNVKTGAGRFIEFAVDPRIHINEIRTIRLRRA